VTSSEKKLGTARSEWRNRQGGGEKTESAGKSPARSSIIPLWGLTVLRNGAECIKTSGGVKQERVGSGSSEESLIAAEGEREIFPKTSERRGEAALARRRGVPREKKDK